MATLCDFILSYPAGRPFVEPVMMSLKGSRPLFNTKTWIRRRRAADRDTARAIGSFMCPVPRGENFQCKHHRVVSRSAEQKQEVYYPRVSAEAEDVRYTIRGFGVLIKNDFEV